MTCVFRKKLEPQNDISPSTRVDGLDEIIRDVHLPETETASVIHVEVPPWADSYEISATEVDGMCFFHRKANFQPNLCA